MPDDLWVMDTSSIIAVRRRPREEHAPVYAGMTRLAENGGLKFPRQVLGELERAHDGQPTDRPYLWVCEVRAHALANGPAMTTVKHVMDRAGDVVDHDKASGAEDADPYVIAVALELQRPDAVVRVVTEDQRNHQRKIALTTACGILGIPAVNLSAFLRMVGIEPPVGDART